MRFSQLRILIRRDHRSQQREVPAQSFAWKRFIVQALKQKDGGKEEP